MFPYIYLLPGGTSFTEAHIEDLALPLYNTMLRVEFDKLDNDEEDDSGTTSPLTKAFLKGIKLWVAVPPASLARFEALLFGE